MNKRLLWVWVFCVYGLLAGNIASAEDKPACDPWAAKIAAVQGIVEAKRTNAEDWHSVKRNGIYCPGDQIRVGKDSRASIILINETLVRLDQFSVITLNKIETEGQSLLELLKGIAHFISRVPRSLKVDTPFVNAAIEGTEFVVAVDESETTVTVFEGTVLTENENGQVRLTQNESSVARRGQAPEKVLLARPRDTVQWALYFPPLIKADAEGNALQQASALLFNGRVKEASELLAGLDSGEAKALQSIIAIVNNDRDTAFQLANEAIQQAPDSAATHIAMSYAHQARLDLDAALASAQTAVDKENNNAIARARLAELQLSVGELDDAVDSARKATELDNGLARAQTILGYAYLTRIDIDEARATFNKAIELDQNDPLPHLGLGLAMIRKNELAEGRREIEIAASLDPNNAIIRSYLGKAYYEEKRGPLDAEQFAMAKELDPNDPTPYYYDAIRKQTENDPVGALEDLNKSIELNDNRAVYRSSLQLDQDEAARSASQARIYSSLGFEQLALLEGWTSVSNDPTNHSAHRFLADSYSELPRHQIAQVSQLLQAQMLQPVITTPVQFLSNQSGLFVSKGSSISNIAINEYNSLLFREGYNFHGDAIFGTNNTIGESVAVSGVHNNFSYSIGQLHYETDGYRLNNDQEQDLINFLAQYNFTRNTSLQLEFRHSELEYGDIESNFDLTRINEEDRFIFDEDTIRFGLRHNINNNSTLLLSYIDKKEDNSSHISRTSVTPPVETTVVTDNLFDLEGKTYEAQYLYITPANKVILGGGVFEQEDISVIDATINVSVGGVPTPPIILPTEIIDRKIDHSNVYFYDYLRPIDPILITLGLSYDDFDDDDLNSSLDVSTDQVSPKFGIEWDINRYANFRLAAFSSFKRPLLSNQTLEPTQIAGFNQFFDDKNAADTERYGAGLDLKLSNNLFAGIEFTKRDITITELSGLLRNQNELLHRLYFYWTPTRSIAISTNYIYDQYSTDFPELNVPNYLKTQTLPIRLSYYIGTLSTSLTTTYVNQYQEHPEGVNIFVNDQDEFITVDFEIGYKFSSNLGHVAISFNNIFDEQFKYQDRNFQTTKDIVSQFIPETNIVIRAGLNF